jgi:hypothetical protein
VADHPVKVPPELFTEWLSEALLQHDAKSGTIAAMVADRAAQWGADQELEACCEWLDLRGFAISSIDALRAVRRPKPPTLAEQGLKALRGIKSGTNNCREQDQAVASLAAALTRLAELEAQQ